MNKLFFSALAAAFLDVNSGLGQTIITSVPYVISHSGTYVLGSSLAYLPANGAAITISASDVIFDMGGHYLSNPGTPSTNVAVQVTNAENVTIQNGIIIGFAYGVYFNYTGGTTNNSGDVVQNLRLKNPVYGIVLAEATGAKVSNNQITNSNGTGIYGLLCSSYPSGGSDVASGNIVSGFNGGILSGGNNYLFENILNNCDTGLFMQASDKYRFNTTFNCTTPFNGGTAVTSENN